MTLPLFLKTVHKCRTVLIFSIQFNYRRFEYLVKEFSTTENMAKKVTSKRVAKVASKQLRRKNTSKAGKTTAGSALSQREKKK